jgi:hypothetical protein
MSSDDTQVMSRGEPDDYVRLSTHPRARRSIARAKAIGGLGGFVLGFWLASKASLPAFETGVRALVGGIAGYVLVWLAAVQIWRQLAIAEYRAVEKHRAAVLAAKRQALVELAEKRKADMDAARGGAS